MWWDCHMIEGILYGCKPCLSCNWSMAVRWIHYETTEHVLLWTNWPYFLFGEILFQTWILHTIDGHVERSVPPSAKVSGHVAGMPFESASFALQTTASYFLPYCCVCFTAGQFIWDSHAQMLLDLFCQNAVSGEGSSFLLFCMLSVQWKSLYHFSVYKIIMVFSRALTTY